MACGAACMVEEAWSEARSNQPHAQDPGMSLCESMCGPHVLVCVRVRGAFQKKKKKKKNLKASAENGFCVHDGR